MSAAEGIESSALQLSAQRLAAELSASATRPNYVMSAAEGIESSALQLSAQRLAAELSASATRPYV